jgi:hypothetical protein
MMALAAWRYVLLTLRVRTLPHAEREEYGLETAY